MCTYFISSLVIVLNQQPMNIYMVKPYILLCDQNEVDCSLNAFVTLIAKHVRGNYSLNLKKSHLETKHFIVRNFEKSKILKKLKIKLVLTLYIHAKWL